MLDAAVGASDELVLAAERDGPDGALDGVVRVTAGGSPTNTGAHASSGSAFVRAARRQV